MGFVLTLEIPTLVMIGYESGGVAVDDNEAMKTHQGTTLLLLLIINLSNTCNEGLCTSRERCRLNNFTFSPLCGFESVCCHITLSSSSVYSSHQIQLLKELHKIPFEGDSNQCGVSKTPLESPSSLAASGMFPWMVSFIHLVSCETYLT